MQPVTVKRRLNWTVQYGGFVTGTLMPVIAHEPFKVMYRLNWPVQYGGIETFLWLSFWGFCKGIFTFELTCSVRRDWDKASVVGKVTSELSLNWPVQYGGIETILTGSSLRRPVLSLNWPVQYGGIETLQVLATMPTGQNSITSVWIDLFSTEGLRHSRFWPQCPLDRIQSPRFELTCSVRRDWD